MVKSKIKNDDIFLVCILLFCVSILFFSIGLFVGDYQSHSYHVSHKLHGRHHFPIVKY